jgi:hypothetical protein
MTEQRQFEELGKRWRFARERAMLAGDIIAQVTIRPEGDRENRKACQILAV